MIKSVALLLALLLASGSVSAQRPALVVPNDPDLVLETLPAGYAGLTAPALPGDTQLPRIQQMLDAAARTGDTRLSTRAQALLERIDPSKVDADVLHAKAFSAQHRHDFDLARELLTEVLRRDPTDAGALLSRAQVNIVQGHLKNARGDCVALALRVDSSLGTICTAALQLRRGDYPSAARLTDRWLMGSDANAGLKRFVLMMRGDVASRMKAPDATNFYEQALALDPQDVRTRLAFARHLRRSAQPREAIAVLESAAASDTVLLQRALAVREAGMPDAEGWGDQLGRRFALARQTGTSTELRDEAEYYLTVRQNPAHGLKLALENFQTQRDLEDEELLEQAAEATRQPEALQVLREWEKDQKSFAAGASEVRP